MKPLILRQSAVISISAVLLAIFGMWHMSGRNPAENHPEQIRTLLSEAPSNRLLPAHPIHLVSVPATTSGIDFIYQGGPGNHHFMTDQNGGGAAVLDFDSDGTLDLLFSNGASDPASHDSRVAICSLYRSVDSWKYGDCTQHSELTAFGFGQGCAAGDYDNDGFTDIFVAGYGVNYLWHNNGDGTFTTAAPLTGCQRWSTSAAFADLDGDGDLDLYVTGYVDWTPEKRSLKRIPSPMDFDGLPDSLYKNEGDGRFSEAGQSAGVSLAVDGKGLAVAVCDLNSDGLLDIFVANDTTRNFLFVNRGNLVFDEHGVSLGVAVSQDGSVGSSMGIAVSDLDRDGIPDLFVTNFAQEVVDVFVGTRPYGFLAINAELGIDPVSRPLLNFGIVSQDFDLDGWPDLFFTNGHLWDEPVSTWQYRMHPSIMTNIKGQRFSDVRAAAGAYFQRKWLGRAVAYGDLDNDSDTDLIVSHLVDPPALLRNETKTASRGMRLRFIGTKSSRQPLGCRVEIVPQGEPGQITVIPSGSSFQASHDPTIVAQAWQPGKPANITLTWPSGVSESWIVNEHCKTLYLIEGDRSICDK